MQEPLSPKPRAEGSSPSAPAKYNIFQMPQIRVVSGFAAIPLSSDF